MSRLWWGLAAGGLVLLLAGLVAAALAWRYFEAPGPLEREAVQIIPKGTGIDGIGRILAEAGVIDHPMIFAGLVRLTGEGSRLKAGEYAFPARVSPQGVVDLLRRGQTVVHRVTVPEGTTSRQIVLLLSATEALSGEIRAVPAEGSLLPETYHFSRGDSRADLVGRMSKAMGQLVDELWQSRSSGLPLRNPQEMVILASIVERETAIAEERPRVAAVFYNRLARGMKLQSDPTTIYGLSQGLGVLDRPLSRRDLEAEHAWNTYVIPGLPPGPIANPGRASLEAVLHPAKTDALYFVADGTGGHVFARTLDEHNLNVARLRRLERLRQGGAP